MNENLQKLIDTLNTLTIQKHIDTLWSMVDQKIKSSKTCQTEKWRNVSFRESLAFKTKALIFEDRLARVIAFNGEKVK